MTGPGSASSSMYQWKNPPFRTDRGAPYVWGKRLPSEQFIKLIIALHITHLHNPTATDTHSHGLAIQDMHYKASLIAVARVLILAYPDATQTETEGQKQTDREFIQNIVQ
jgi:hypothetical protein